MKCENCGRELPPHTSSCKYCGWSMLETTQKESKKSYTSVIIKLGIGFVAFVFICCLFSNYFPTHSSNSDDIPTILDSSDDEYSDDDLDWDEDESEDSDEEYTEITTESPKTLKKERKEYISSCKSYNYKDIARYPDDYIGSKIKITVRISQKMTDDWFDDGQYYVCHSDNDGSGYYIDDCYYIIDDRIGDNTKLLEDDIIEIYGEIVSPTKLQHTLTGATDDYVTIDMRYYKLLSN